MTLAFLVGGGVVCGGWLIFRCLRRRVEAAERLHAVTLSSIGDAVIATDIEGTITFINPEAERLTGWPREEAVGCPLEHVFRVVNERTGAASESPVAVVMRTGQPQALSNHTRLAVRGGGSIPIENKASPIRHADGTVDGVVLIFRDCTQRYQVEEALRERVLLREQLAQIADTAPGVICAYRVRPDGSSAFPFASPRIHEVYGLTPEELARDAAPAFGAIHPDDLEHVRVTAAESARTLEEWREEFRVNHPAKGLIWVEGRSMPEIEPDGSVLWRGFLTDVTARKRAEEALHESEERFRQIAENIREVFFLTNADLTEMVYISPAYDAVWGRPRAALLESPEAWIDAVHSDDRERVRRALTSNARRGGFDEEYRIVRPDSSVRWIHARAFPVRGVNGEIVRHAGVAEDITERRQLESELRQAQKMESVGLLAGGVAHDFNNALTVIMGSTELLTDEVAPSSEAAETLEEIRKATDRAASLTRQLLSFSRKDVIAPRVVDFNALVSDTERMLRRLLGEDIDLCASLDQSIAHVRIDPGQWDQVLVNLAVNARDAITGCGRLTIETRDVVISARSAATSRGVRPGRYVRLSVSDTGCGMPADVVSRIFEPFFTTKGVGRGTGLGLAVVYGIVSQSGGYIDVQSRLNVGTTFTILIPAVDAAVEARSAQLSRPQPSSTDHPCETILLVEDEDSLRRMARRVLVKQGYTVLEAASGPDALRLLDEQQCRIDLLVTDVVMPTMDGRELAERVRQKQPSAKVLFTSGYTEDAIVHRGVEAASVAFLQKPYVPAVLSNKVVEVLHQSAHTAA